jgi:hypothetical protein
MKKLILLAALLPGLAVAHHDEAHAQVLAQAAPRAAPGSAMPGGAAPDQAIQEMQREQANPNATPWVPQQNRDAADADALSMDDAAAQLRAAMTSLRAKRTGQANEFLERAESRLLTRSTLPSRAEDPVRTGPVARIAAARAALMRNDARTATAEIEAALDAMQRPRRLPPATADRGPR